MEDYLNKENDSQATDYNFQICSPLSEAVENSIRKEGMSFVFESRFVEAVVQYVYTPIDGTFSDLEVEVNGNEPFTPSEDGGIVVSCNGQDFSPDNEEVERHFISCELVDDSVVEARWQWIVNGEKSNFLYRFYLEGKSLVTEVEGGAGKCSGISLGRVTGVTNPIIFPLPYFTIGNSYPHFLHASGVFISSMIDWNTTNSTKLTGIGIEEAQREFKLNGGCEYSAREDGSRMALHDRWVLTVSDKVEEVIPYLPLAQNNEVDPEPDILHDFWLNVAYPQKNEESYVNVYEQLRLLKQYGLHNIFVNHPAATWTDGELPAYFELDGSSVMGGADALSEYVDGVGELGYGIGLYTSFFGISPNHPDYSVEKAAIGPDGKPIMADDNSHIYKASIAHNEAKTHVRKLVEKFPPAVPILADHSARNPSDFTDCDKKLIEGVSFRKNIDLQKSLFSGIEDITPLFAEGGNHWLYPGIAKYYYAKIVGTNPSKITPILDFELGMLHRLNVDVGVGDIEEYFQDEIPDSNKNSRSIYLNRYIAATAAYGHIGLLPDPTNWGVSSTLKMYFILNGVQRFYAKSPVDSIMYHKNGAFLNLGDAIVESACEFGQIKIEYANGTVVIVNLGDSEFVMDIGEKAIVIPSGGYWIEHSQSGTLSYSILNDGNRIDYSISNDHLYIDTYGIPNTIGPISTDGAVLVQEQKWQIDVTPIECVEPVKIDVAALWPDRKLPPLRVIAFNSDDESSISYKAEMVGDIVILPQLKNIYKYRIALPEWMVEPGK